MPAWLTLILSPIFRDYKWFRKKTGGKWYKVRPEDSTAWGIADSWTREPGKDEVVEEEDYAGR